MKKTCILAMLLLAAFQSSYSTVDHLLPKVKNYTTTGNVGFYLNRDISVDAVSYPLLAEVLTDAGARIAANAAATVTVQIVETIPGAFNHNVEGYPHEAYTITISADNINITALNPTGVIRAAQTLSQLAIGTDTLESAEVVDWPAFKVRGYMHDVGRSFISVDELKKELRLLSQFKINTFHWHFTENQAWRFQVNQYPQLTESRNMTRFAGSYYTQAQCREVVEEAKKYGIIIIPEIDMPGHSQAFKTAMGHGMQTAQGKEELKNILTEVVAVFDASPYIHIGADEETITDGTFLQTMINHVHGLGKKVMCWNPISGVTIKNYNFDMTQMWSTAGTKVPGIPNIDCRYNYVNHFDVFADLVGIYKSSIYYEEKGTDEVAGSITAVWNDRKTPDEHHIIAQNNIYANILATGERAWAGGGEHYIEDGGTMLPNSGAEYEEFADWERRFLLHKDLSLANEAIPYVKQTNVRWNVTQGFQNGGNVNAVFAPETNLESAQFTSTPVTGAGIYLRHTWPTVVSGLYGNAAYNQTAYAYTYVYSPTARTVGALIEFQNYGRSEKDRAPEAGQWDRKGSKVWVNNKEILPPTWDNTGKPIDNEVDLLNENFTARPPVSVELNQGWNKVLIKLPYVALPASEVRLNKWMYTFVFTEPDGRHAVADLVYSPSKVLDADADALLQLITEARAAVEAVIKDEVGYYNTSELDQDLLDKCDEIEATLAQTLASEDRKQQISDLTALLAAFRAGYADKGLVMPDQYTYYYFYTPLRDNRYVNSTSTLLTSVSAPDSSAAWLFEPRADHTYDIVNYTTHYYISPGTAYNSQLTLSSSRPDRGWELKPASTLGLVTIVSGTDQVNMTNEGLRYVVYNWGEGVNTTDTGCQYKFVASPYSEEKVPDGIDGILAESEAQGESVIYNLQGQRLASPATGINIINGVKVISK